MDYKAFYTIEEVAELLKLHVNTVRRYCKDGLLQAKKIGKRWYIVHESIIKFLR